MSTKSGYNSGYNADSENNNNVNTNKNPNKSANRNNTSENNNSGKKVEVFWPRYHDPKGLTTEITAPPHKMYYLVKFKGKITERHAECQYIFETRNEKKFLKVVVVHKVSCTIYDENYEPVSVPASYESTALDYTKTLSETKKSFYINASKMKGLNHTAITKGYFQKNNKFIKVKFTPTPQSEAAYKNNINLYGGSRKNKYKNSMAMTRHKRR